MRNKVKKLLLGLASSMIFFGSNVYAAVGDIVSSSGGVSVGAIIGVVLVVLVLLLGYKMDKAAEESEKDKDNKNEKSIKSLEDELDAESKESEYAPIKEDMPYEEEAGEGYEEEETIVSTPTPPPVVDEEPESSFSGPAAASANESYTVDTSKGTASFRADPIPDFATTSTSSKVSDETMVFSSKEDTKSAEDVSEEPEVNYTGFDATSSTVEDEISKLDDYNQEEEESFSFGEDASTDDSSLEQDEEPDPYDLNDGINKNVVEEAPVNLDTSNGEIASFSFDSDSFSSMNDEDEENEDEASTLASASDEDNSYEFGDLNAQIDSLDEEDAEVEEKVTKEVEEYKQKVNIEKEEFTGFTTKEDEKPASKEDESDFSGFTTKEDEKSASKEVEEFTGFTTKEDIKEAESDEDQFTSSNSEEDMDNIDFVEPVVKKEDPYERDPETLEGFTTKEDVGFSGGFKKSNNESVKVQDPTMSEEFTFARDTEKSAKEKMTDEELVASTDLDNGFLNQMEENLKRNQENRMGDKK